MNGDPYMKITVKMGEKKKAFAEYILWRYYKCCQPFWGRQQENQVRKI